MSSPSGPVPIPVIMQEPPQSDAEDAAALDSELVPNIDKLVIDNDEPVASQFVEKQQRLLTEPLYDSWSGSGRSFKVFANVGLFYALRQPPVVPDVMLALDVPASADLSKKENRSYFMWIMEKRPEVIIEIVSDRRGGEESDKKARYAQIGVPYYAVFDPERHLSQDVLRIYRLQAARYQDLEGVWLEDAGLGLTMWEGEFEAHKGRWLRWCDRNGHVIPTGRERAEAERQRAERLAEQLRAHGIEPAEN